MTVHSHLSPRSCLALASAICLALLGVVVIAGPAQAASLQAVTLCVTKSGPDKGAVRFVGTSTHCRKGEKKVTVLTGSDEQGVLGAQESSPGAPGAPGAPGEKGLKGDQGEPGAQGDPGA